MLQVEGLVKAYGDVRALDGLDLSARPGRLLGFLGPNGAGKTTTMRAVFGLVRPDAGSVTWRGAPTTAQDLFTFGYMPEQRGLYPRMATRAQLVYLGRLHGLSVADAQAAADRWLEQLGLADRAGTRLSELSHGNQQRVQLAAALVHDPPLLVLDEPFNGLDPMGVQAMSEVLRQRAADGATVVFSSHQLDLVEDLCDDVVIIASGRARLAGSLDEVREATGLRRVQVRMVGGVTPALTTVPAEAIRTSRDGVRTFNVPAGTDPTALLADLATQGAVDQFSFEPPPLSEIFREAVGQSVADAGQVAS